MTDDTIYRQAAIKELLSLNDQCNSVYYTKCIDDAVYALEILPSAQQTLYGYRIEHLAYIAKVMEKEGVTAEYAVRTFDDMSRVIKMIIDEIQQKVEEALNG